MRPQGRRHGRPLLAFDGDPFEKGQVRQWSDQNTKNFMVGTERHLPERLAGKVWQGLRQGSGTARKCTCIEKRGRAEERQVKALEDTEEHGKTPDED